MSFILSQILTKKVPDWNKTVWTEDKFSQECVRHKVRIVEDENLKVKGEYTVYKDVSFIALRPKLKNNIKLWVIAHEFGHHLLHYPVTHKFSRSIFIRMDREANFFAAIALIPSSLVTTKTLGEIMEEYNYPKELIIIRKEIWDVYKI